MSFRVPFSLSTLFPAVPKYQRGCDWADFHEIWFLGAYIKIIPETATLVTSDKIIGNLT
jgi:hypothetical protein